MEDRAKGYIGMGVKGNTPGNGRSSAVRVLASTKAMNNITGGEAIGGGDAAMTKD